MESMPNSMAQAASQDQPCQALLALDDEGPAMLSHACAQAIAGWPQ